jgi:hypothetical protein
MIVGHVEKVVLRSSMEISALEEYGNQTNL